MAQKKPNGPGCQSDNRLKVNLGKDGPELFQRFADVFQLSRTEFISRCCYAGLHTALRSYDEKVKPMLEETRGVHKFGQELGRLIATRVPPVELEAMENAMRLWQRALRLVEIAAKELKFPNNHNPITRI